MKLYRKMGLGMGVIWHVRYGCLFSCRYAAGMLYFPRGSGILAWLIGLITYNYY